MLQTPKRKEAPMYRSILVPLDGSRASEHALPLAISIARRSGATLQLAHVHEPARPMFMDAVPLFDEPHDAEHRDRERAYLDDLARRLAKGHKLTITTTLLNGPVADAIIVHAVASSADLIVMTTHGRSAPALVWLGGVADKLVRWAPPPLLLVRPQDALPDPAPELVCRHVLIPLDSSTQSQQILSHAIALGTLLQAEYTLLYVIDSASATCTTDSRTGIDSKAHEQLCCCAQAYLRRIAARLRAEALRVATAVVIGPPADAIQEYVRAHAIDLIAMERQEWCRDGRMLMGSVADNVLCGAAVPLLLHHPHHGTRPDVCWSVTEIWAGRMNDERSSVDDVLTFA